MANCTKPVKSCFSEKEAFEEDSSAKLSGDMVNSRSWREIASLVACEQDAGRAFELTKDLFRALDVEVTSREAEKQNTYKTMQR